MNKVKI